MKAAARVAGVALVGLAGLTPLLAWLAPLAFAPVVALMGLLSLPTVRMRDEDRPGLIVLFALLIWAAASTAWSPFQPKSQGVNILKLAFELPLYFAAVCGARAAPPRFQRLALTVLAFATAAFGLLMLVEGLTGGVIYRSLHQAFYEPIRIDLAQKNLGHAAFVFALIWPLATLAAPRKLRPGVALAIAAGILGAGLAFGSDAPVLSVMLTPVIAFLIWKKPNCGPKVFAGLVGALFILIPGVVWISRKTGVFARLEELVPLSWSLRMGYWRHAADWIADHPLRGWGLDASRMFAPGIQLHPHNGQLQIWLELGAVGAIAAAAFFAVTLLRLSRPKPSLAMAAAAAASGAYILFGAVNFGIWQEWWLALGGLACAFTAVLAAEESRTSAST